MLSFDHALAILLLTTPLKPDDLGPHLDVVKPALLNLAVELEILDRREDQFFEGLSQDLVGDIQALQQRFRKHRCFPQLAECERFPERKLIEEFLSFNRAYRKDLVLRLEIDCQRTEELRSAIHEVDQHYLVWSLLRDARCRFYYVTARRESLGQLRDLVGAEAYYRSQLPPPVPRWHFPAMK